jgi:hypothetical protein
MQRGDAKEIEARTSKRQFILTWVQPGLAGLMDGSVSTRWLQFLQQHLQHKTLGRLL